MVNCHLFKLVTAAHHCITAAALSRDVDTIRAVSVFVEEARRQEVPRPIVEAVMLRVLMLATRYFRGHFPSVLERFSCSLGATEAIDQFSECIIHVVRATTVHECVRDVQTGRHRGRRGANRSEHSRGDGCWGR